MSEKSDKEFISTCDSFRSPKIVKLEQQNEALLAQVEELRDAIHEYAGTGRDEQWQAVKSAMSAQPEQSLDSLKARIVGECIDIAKNTAGAKTQIIKALCKYQPSTKADK